MEKAANTKWFYVVLNERQSRGKKTNVYDVFSNSDHHLGQIRWYASWRQYCFFPAPYTLFNTECMDEICAFISQLHEERKRS